LVTLQSFDVRIARFSDRQGKLRFARSSRSFEQKRLPELGRKEDNLGNQRVYEVARGGEFS
jgi:hypothetical protein